MKVRHLFSTIRITGIHNFVIIQWAYSLYTEGYQTQHGLESQAIKQKIIDKCVKGKGHKANSKQYDVPLITVIRYSEI